MIQGIGTDIIAVARIKGMIERHGVRFLDRVFTLEEQNYCLRYRQPERHFAGRFAAKEALAKALGVGIGKHLSWLDIEILNDEDGKPIVYCSEHVNDLFGTPKFLLSISHCHEYATAMAVRV